MSDLDELHAEFLSTIEAWNALDVDAILTAGHGVGYGYRVREARSFDAATPEEARRRVEAVVASYEYFRIRDPEWHGRIDGDIGVQWGFFTEEFQYKGLDAETTRVSSAVSTDGATVSGCDCGSTAISSRLTSPAGTSGHSRRHRSDPALNGHKDAAA